MFAVVMVRKGHECLPLFWFVRAMYVCRCFGS